MCTRMRAWEGGKAVDGDSRKNLARSWLRCRDEEEFEVNASIGSEDVKPHGGRAGLGIGVAEPEESHGCVQQSRRSA
jgi:hypothetical protein